LFSITPSLCSVKILRGAGHVPNLRPPRRPPPSAYQPVPTVYCPASPNGGFVPVLVGRGSFVFNQLGGFVFQKALSFQPVSRWFTPCLLPCAERLMPSACSQPPFALCIPPFAHQTVASFLTFPQLDPLFSCKSVASFFKKALSFQPVSRWFTPCLLPCADRLMPSACSQPPFGHCIPPFAHQTVASFLTFPQLDPLFSCKSVASFFKKALSFQPSAVISPPADALCLAPFAHRLRGTRS